MGPQEALLVRVDTRTLLRVDSVKEIDDRQAFGVTILIFIRVCDSKELL